MAGAPLVASSFAKQIRVPLRIRQQKIEQLPFLATLGVAEIESQLAEAGEELQGKRWAGIAQAAAGSRSLSIFINVTQCVFDALQDL